MSPPINFKMKVDSRWFAVERGFLIVDPGWVLMPSGFVYLNKFGYIRIHLHREIMRQKDVVLRAKLLVTAMFLEGLCLVAFAQQPTSVYSGKVVGPTAQPVAGATVQLEVGRSRPPAGDRRAGRFPGFDQNERFGDTGSQSAGLCSARAAHFAKPTAHDHAGTRHKFPARGGYGRSNRAGIE